MPPSTSPEEAPAEGKDRTVSSLVEGHDCQDNPQPVAPTDKTVVVSTNSIARGRKAMVEALRRAMSNQRGSTCWDTLGGRRDFHPNTALDQD